MTPNIIGRWLAAAAATPLAAFGTGAGAAAAAAAPVTAAAPPLVQETVRPVRVTRRADGVFFLDFGRDAFGYLELDLPAPPAGAAGRKIVVRLGEKRAGGDALDRAPGGSVRFLETSIATAAGQTAYRPALPARDARWMPPAVGAAMPFRCVELANLPDGTTAEYLSGHVRQIAVHAPFDDTAADFACSDAKLNAVWDLCKYTMKATSYAGVFVDGDRERKPYEADAYINALGWYYCAGDPTLPRRTQEYLLAHPTWPTEWSLFSIFSAWTDWRYTGDTAPLAAQYDDLKAKTLRALERPDGLIGTVEPPVPASVYESIHLKDTMRDIVDWPQTERDGYRMAPVNTVVNAFYCRSLQMMGDIAAALGKTGDAAEFRAAAAQTLASLNGKLADPKSGLYVDGEGSDHCSLHANMFPLAFGLVPADRKAKVLAFVQSRGMACSVYGAQFLMDALFGNGRGPEAVRLMTAPGDRSWRHMVEDVGTTIALEAWDDKFKPNQDWNHAWGAAPANLLPRMVLGVEPLEPGYRRTLIWPRCAGRSAAGVLAWARGKVPTTRGGGAVAVEWHQTAAGFHLTAELPSGTSGAVVRLPDDWGDRVLVDGKPTTGRAQDGTIDVELATPGRHVVSVGR